MSIFPHDGSPGPQYVGRKRNGRRKGAPNVSADEARERYAASDSAVVLVVEDERPQREAVGDLLRAWGYRPMLAESVARAQELAPTADLVLLDVGLPDGDGYDLCLRLRSARETALTPVLIISGAGCRVEARVEGLECGADGFLAKPVHPDELRAAIRTLLRARRAEEVALRLEAQLARARNLETIGREAGGIAHDFNNLLTVINGCVGLALRALPPGASDLRDMLEEARQAGERAAVRTRQLLSFVRGEVFNLRAVDLNVVLAGFLPTLRRAIGDGIEARLDLSADLPAVRADPDRIEQIILNLAVNARDAMPRGGVLTVCTRSLPGGRWVEVSVADTGIGMEEAVRLRAFEPFFSTKGPLGTGLGLAMVAGVVQAHAGQVDVESRPGNGSVFRVRLPRAELPIDGPRSSPATDLPGGRETVLLVEDDPSVRGFTAAALRSFGYLVLEADSREAALATADTYAGTIHLLFTDVVMPGMSASDLAMRLVATRPGMRVLMTTGLPEGDELRTGVDDRPLLVKPFGLRDLAVSIRTLLDA